MTEAILRGTETPSSPDTSLLRVDGISKSFPGVRALINVDFDLAAGEVNALVGENGAGKSTLIKILSGNYSADEGVVMVGGQPLDPSPRAAHRAGVATIYQEHHLVPMMSVAENIMLGRWPRRHGLIDRAALNARANAALARVAPQIRSDRMAATLSPAESQLIEIARALSQDSRVLIMDEPTTSLSGPEVAQLFEVIRHLKAQGMGIVFVSHWLEEVFAIADRITVIRDGHLVACRATADLTPEAVVHLMVGRAVQEIPHTARVARKVVLDVKGLSRAGAFEDINFCVCEGEIVCLAGLVGAGRSELAACIFGDDAADAGEITLDGRRLAPGDIRAAIAAGVALVPEDRRRQALIGNQSVAVNATLAVLDRITRSGIVSQRREAVALETAVTAVGARMASVAVPISTLSGGNQQKVVIGRWLARKPRLLILDEPTKGIDIGAKAEIMELIQRLTDEGTAILLITSELPEVLALSDRALVMRSGRIVGELPRAKLSQEAVMNLATLG